MLNFSFKIGDKNSKEAKPDGSSPFRPTACLPRRPKKGH
jgi:hypothetical protein